MGEGKTEKTEEHVARSADGGEGDDPGHGLFERETELAALSAALAAARSGAGKLVVLEGPAGIGKSRLLAAAREIANAHGMAVLTARAIDLERDAPFGVAADLFTPVLTGPVLTGPVLTGRALSDGGPAAADEAGRQRERARLLSGQAALTTALFDPVAQIDPVAQASADSSALVRGLYWLTVNVAAGAPYEERPAGLLIEVDDAQWADRPSLSYLAYLAARINELPAVLMIAARSGEPPVDPSTLDWLRDRAGRSLLRPRALTPEAIARMAAAELSSGGMSPAELPTADPAFTRACAEVTGGNPFLATELLRALRADGIAPTASAVAQVRSLVPDSVLRAVLVRLARLGESAEQLAKAVAVLGDRAPMRQARQLAGLAAPDAEQAADALAEAHILDPGEPLSFAHPLIATSVYADIPAFARARAHRRAADLLAADGAAQDVVVAQLLLTRPDGDQRTVATLREAAARAGSRGDPEAAAHLLQRALAEPPGAAERGRVLLELADAEIEHGDAAAAGERISEALALLDAPADRVRALTALGRLRFHEGAHEAAARVTEEALELLNPDDPALPPLLVWYLTSTMFRAGLHPLTTARVRQLLEAARAGQVPQDPGLLAHLVLRLAFAAEPAARVSELAGRATAADPLVDHASLGMLHGLVVTALCTVDDLAAAERISSAALAEAQRRGSMLSFSQASFHRALSRYHRGELASALADLDQSWVATREGWTAGDSWSGGLAVQIHLERGDLAAARDALALLENPPPDSMNIPVGLFARARLALAEGRPAQALSDAETAGKLLSEGFGIDHPGFMPWQRTAALAALALGDDDRARRRADELLARARWSGVARATGLALRTQAALTDGEKRRRLLSEAADVLAASPSALERAHALVELGTACRRAGLRPIAERRLREGLQLADGMGAAPLVEAARHELRALGLRPRRSAVTGPDALTPTERRVAELAGSGLTNRQVAEALFVTVKTVETHLARVYQKLGISTRAELVRSLSP